MVESFEGGYLAFDMLDKIFSVLGTFCRLKTVGLDGDMIGLIEVIALVDLAEASASKQLKR